jgi:hypothetical protein
MLLIAIRDAPCSCSVVLGKADVGQREQEGDQLVDLVLGQGQRLDAAVQVQVRLAALVVMVHHVPQRRQRAVMHVRRRDPDVQDQRRAEGADVHPVAGHHEASQFAQVRAHGQLVQLLLRGVFVQGLDRPSRQALEILVPGRHADIVEAVVAAQRIARTHGMTGGAARLAVEQFPAGLRLGRQGRRVARQEATEGRIQEYQRPFEGPDGPAQVLVVHLPAKGLLEGRLVLGVAGDRLHRRGLIREPHLDRIQNRLPGLVVQAGRAAVPEHRLQQGRVRRRRRIAFADLLADSQGSGQPVRKAARHVVAGRARYRAVGRQTLVEVQLAAQRHSLGRQRVVFRQVSREHHRIESRRRLDRRVVRDQLGQQLHLIRDRGRAQFVSRNLGRRFAGNSRIQQQAAPEQGERDRCQPRSAEQEPRALHDSPPVKRLRDVEISLGAASATLLAEADEMHRIVLDFKTSPLARGHPQAVQAARLEVDDAAAFPADQMVVPVNLAVEAGPAAGMLQPPNQAQFHEHVQDPINGRARESRNVLLDGLVNLIGRRMVVPLQDRLQDVPTLDRQRHPPLATESFEPLQPLRDLVRLHCRHKCK